jgi:hypothetical protein
MVNVNVADGLVYVNPVIRMIMANFQEQMVDIEEALMGSDFDEAAERAEMFVKVIRGLRDIVG